MSSIGPRKPPKHCAPPPNPRFEIFKHTLTRIGSPWWVYDSHVGAHDGHSARYETRAEVEALVTWLNDRAAGYPRNPAMDVWPPEMSYEIRVQRWINEQLQTATFNLLYGDITQPSNVTSHHGEGVDP